MQRRAAVIAVLLPIAAIGLLAVPTPAATTGTLLGAPEPIATEGAQRQWPADPSSGPQQPDGLPSLHGPKGDPEEVLQFHIRIQEDGILLFSTHPNETGLLQDGPNGSTGAPLKSALSAFPPVLQPVAQVLRAAPNVSGLSLSGFDLASAGHVEVQIVGHQEFDRFGVMTKKAAAEFFGDELGSGDFILAGIPLRVAREDGVVSYEIAIDEPMTFPVPKTNGLMFVAEPTSPGTVSVKLVAASGEFTSAGCEPVPGTLLPPGHYVLKGSDGAIQTYDVFPSKVEFGLQNRRVDVDVTIIKSDNEQEDQDR